MSRDYRIVNSIQEVPFRPELRTWCQRPGKRAVDGKPQYTTEQSHKKECDVNSILKKYDKTGLITHVSRIEVRFGDLRGVDFKDAMDLIAGATTEFQSLPSHIRKRFENSPEKLLEFMESDQNRAEAIKLGLISPDSEPGSDGLGEHVKEPSQPAPK